MKIYAMTKKGVCKNENEDRIIVNNSVISEGYYEFDVNGAVIAIADGVGGSNAGVAASNFLAVHLAKCNHEDIDINMFKDINSELITKSISEVSLNNMATTLSGISIKNITAKLFHVGNTRINIMQESYLKQLTDDHTTVNWLVKVGKMTAKDAVKYDKRNEITACFGGGNKNLINQMVFIDNCI